MVLFLVVQSGGFWVPVLFSEGVRATMTWRNLNIYDWWVSGHPSDYVKKYVNHGRFLDDPKLPEVQSFLYSSGAKNSRTELDFYFTPFRRHAKITAQEKMCAMDWRGYRPILH